MASCFLYTSDPHDSLSKACVYLHTKLPTQRIMDDLLGRIRPHHMWHKKCCIWLQISTFMWVCRSLIFYWRVNDIQKCDDFKRVADYLTNVTRLRQIIFYARQINKQPAEFTNGACAAWLLPICNICCPGENFSSGIEIGVKPGIVVQEWNLSCVDGANVKYMYHIAPEPGKRTAWKRKNQFVLTKRSCRQKQAYWCRTQLQSRHSWCLTLEYLVPTAPEMRNKTWVSCHVSFHVTCYGVSTHTPEFTHCSFNSHFHFNVILMTIP